MKLSRNADGIQHPAVRRYELLNNTDTLNTKIIMIRKEGNIEVWSSHRKYK